MSQYTSPPSAIFTPPTSNPLESAVDWMAGTLTGSVATTLCIIAIAWVGFSMMSGRMPIRKGGRVVLGCFLLLGAPVIAAGLGGLWQSERGAVPIPPVAEAPADPRGDLPPANYDPYAGASLPRE